LAGAPLRRIEARIAAVAMQPEAVSGQILAVRALLALFQGRIEGVLRLVEQARSRLTEDDGFWYLITQWLWHLLRIADESEAHRENVLPLQLLIQSQLEGQNMLLTVLSLCSLGELRMKQGRLREAEALYKRALAQATDAQGERAPIAGESLIWLGDIARERNDLEAAERYLTEGLERVSEWGRLAALEGYLALARLREAQGEVAATDAALDRAEQLAVIFDATEMDDHMVALHRARIAALRGEFEAVARWAAARGLDALDPDDLRLDATVELHIRKYELAVLGLARVLEGRPRAALTLLEPLLAWIAAKGRWQLGIEALALQAAAHHLLGETPRALTLLEGIV
jgi:LuxR family maltose regulon positive regulatory protein